MGRSSWVLGDMMPVWDWEGQAGVSQSWVSGRGEESMEGFQLIQGRVRQSLRGDRICGCTSSLCNLISAHN
jgi:hypothetical protein